MAHRNSSSSFTSPRLVVKISSSAGTRERGSLALVPTAAVSCRCVSRRGAFGGVAQETSYRA